MKLQSNDEPICDGGVPGAHGENDVCPRAQVCNLNPQLLRAECVCPKPAGCVGSQSFCTNRPGNIAPTPARVVVRLNFERRAVCEQIVVNLNRVPRVRHGIGHANVYCRLDVCKKERACKPCGIQTCVIADVRVPGPREIVVRTRPKNSCKATATITNVIEHSRRLAECVL